DGSDISYSTYIGGSNAEIGRGIFVNPATGVVYITGATESNNYPMVNPYDDTFSAHTDCFVTKVADDGLTLNYSTYIGSDQWETGYSIFVDSTGKMFVVGSTSSSDFPTFNAIDDSYNLNEDAFVLYLDEIPPSTTSPPPTSGNPSDFFNKVVGGLKVWAWFTIGGGVLILAILIPVLVVTMKKRAKPKTTITETSPKIVEDTPKEIIETPKLARLRLLLQQH
ncbi:MAG: hypothetical protein ACTSSK_06515, partial [Candidatus Heimdallarchaeota archaeon]